MTKNKKIVFEVTLSPDRANYTAYELTVALKEVPEEIDSADENYIRWLRDALVRGIEEEFKPHVREGRRIYERKQK